jgi:HSP20 family protein
MSELTRWEPFTTRWDAFKDWEDRMAALSGRVPARKTGEQKEAMTVAEWAPLVDISEDDKEYLIKAELPEVKKEDVKLTVNEGILTITGERKSEKEEKGKKFHRIERSYGSFMRSFTLPEDSDETKVAAEFKEGILKVHLPKSEQAKPKNIEVKIS